MKSDIHPEYYDVVMMDISCDFKVLTRSTMTSSETVEWEDGKSYPVIKLDISSASHPFYTGKRQAIADRGGRVEQFRRRYKIEEEAKAEAEAEAKVEAEAEA